METINESIKLLFKLISIVGMIWGVGWLLYENTSLFRGFTQSSYQNMLLVVMSATWLIILLIETGKSKPKQHYHPSQTPEPVLAKEKRRYRKKPINKQQEHKSTNHETSIVNVNDIVRNYLHTHDRKDVEKK